MEQYEESYPVEGGKGGFTLLLRPKFKSLGKVVAPSNPKPPATPPASTAGGERFVSEDGVNIRSVASSLNNSPIGQVNRNDKVKLSQEPPKVKQGNDGKEWVKIIYNGSAAWICRDYLRNTIIDTNVSVPAMPKVPSALGKYISPFEKEATISSLFGYRMNNGAEFHSGWDIYVADGIELLSIANGIVVANQNGTSGNGGGYGWNVIIKYNDHNIGTFCALYAHMKYQSKLNAGDSIKQGDIVGYQGGTDVKDRIGYGSHLHFQTCRGDSFSYDPHNAFNALKVLYGINMDKVSMNHSGKFLLHNSFSWEKAFQSKYPNGIKESKRPNGTIHRCNDPEILKEMKAILS